MSTTLLKETAEALRQTIVPLGKFMDTFKPSQLGYIDTAATLNDVCNALARADAWLARKPKKAQYRLLRKGELVRRTDQCHWDYGWGRVWKWRFKVSEPLVGHYRRRITKP